MNGRKVSIGEFHNVLVLESFPEGLTDNDALILFGILHSLAIELAYPVLSDRAVGVTRISAPTQRSVGEAIAVMFPTGDERCDYFYWYRRWNEWGSYSRLEQLTQREIDRALELKRRLEEHPFVARLVPDD
jgi:hypothetical protein